ncbi:hypothetical protein QAD02_006971 [Eretmocerus hayati]|uniref:Uncharacterized protein n=1 Tax=Eretmocerus hayati TaxID=131215 RepID=A0ACC2N2L6_9HYME|nr:hypothetical protein QAD02_006971 [Eretmocerus hayati]
MLWLLALSLTSLAVVARHVAGGGSNPGVPRLRGVSPTKSSLYPPDRHFECLDGSLRVPFNFVNDEYCDCADGSDEPGTPACPNGTFFCQNTGHQAANIPSSWVNDGVCDCCDASDEYKSGAECVDNCHELGREALLEAQRTAELVKEGNKIRHEYIAKGKELREENAAKLAKLRADYEEAQLLKKEREVVKNTAEERETAALEKYKPAPPAEQPSDSEDGTSDYTPEEYFKLLDSDSSGTVTVAELQTRVTFDKDRNGEVSHEEAAFFLNNQEELTLQEFTDSAWANIKPKLMLEKGLFKPVEREQLETAEGEVEEVGQAAEEQEQPEPPKETKPEYDEETQALVDEAREAREKFHEAERAVSDLHNDIRETEERIERDYGPEDEFAPLDGQCFEFTDLEYVYSLCLYGKATQRSKSGGGDVDLGRWNSWIGDNGNKYSKAKFDRGLTCWNGPARSTIVTLKCGKEDKLLSVSEPNRCEYAMEFETPALCNPNVEDKLTSHDEL